MSASPVAANIVARFLKQNGYMESYNTFMAESRIGEVTLGQDDLTIEALLKQTPQHPDGKIHDRDDDTDGATTAISIPWTLPAPHSAKEVVLPSSANIIAIENAYTANGTVVLASTADRALHMIDPVTNAVVRSYTDLQDAPILSFRTIRRRHLVSSSMSGQLVLSDLEGQVLEIRKDHTKYLTQILIYDDEHDASLVLVTAGWDKKVLIYRPNHTTDGCLHIGPPLATIVLESKPEAVVILPHPETKELILVVTRSDSSYLHFYTTDCPQLIGRQNLMPHSNSGTAMTPTSVVQNPTDPHLYAIVSLAIPYMRLSVVRLLFPRLPPISARPRMSENVTHPAKTQPFLSRDSPDVAGLEAAAIILNCSIMAPQTLHSTPAVVWRSDGSGVWVTGDDGLIRGIELGMGKLVATLKGHRVGTKVRCILAGTWDGQEQLIRGGFDQKLLVWTS